MKEGSLILYFKHILRRNVLSNVIDASKTSSCPELCMWHSQVLVLTENQAWVSSSEPLVQNLVFAPIAYKLLEFNQLVLTVSSVVTLKQLLQLMRASVWCWCFLCCKCTRRENGKVETVHFNVVQILCKWMNEATLSDLSLHVTFQKCFWIQKPNKY